MQIVLIFFQKITYRIAETASIHQSLGTYQQLMSSRVRLEATDKKQMCGSADVAMGNAVIKL